MRDLCRIHVHDVAFSPADARRRARGVVGFATVSLNGSVRVSGFKVWRDPEGIYSVSFPTKRDRLGKYHVVLEPLGPAARRSIEGQILDALREQGVLP